jgi:hypothetical protein
MCRGPAMEIGRPVPSAFRIDLDTHSGIQSKKPLNNVSQVGGTMADRKALSLVGQWT